MEKRLSVEQIVCDVDDLYSKNSIEYSDLVVTFKLDSSKRSKYTNQEFSKYGTDSIFLKAAKEADLVSKSKGYDSLKDNDTSNKQNKTGLMTQFLFFNIPQLNFSNESMKQIFEDYHQECNNALSYPFSKPQLINIVDHEVIYPDIIKFTLYGDLTGRESLSLLHKPTTNLYTQLEKIIGKNIRSINGIKRVYK